MIMVDTVTLVSDWCATAGTSLYTLVGARIWCPERPPKSTWDGSTAAIIFHPETETTVTCGATIETDVVFKCYAATYTAARAVYQALYDRLQMATGTKNGRTMFRANLITAFQGPPDPDTGAPLCVARFRILTANN